MDLQQHARQVWGEGVEGRWERARRWGWGWGGYSTRVAAKVVLLVLYLYTIPLYHYHHHHDHDHYRVNHSRDHSCGRWSREGCARLSRRDGRRCCALCSRSAGTRSRCRGRGCARCAPACAGSSRWMLVFKGEQASRVIQESPLCSPSKTTLHAKGGPAKEEVGHGAPRHPSAAPLAGG